MLSEFMMNIHVLKKKVTHRLLDTIDESTASANLQKTNLPPIKTPLIALC